MVNVKIYKKKIAYCTFTLALAICVILNFFIFLHLKTLKGHIVQLSIYANQWSQSMEPIDVANQWSQSMEPINGKYQHLSNIKISKSINAIFKFLIFAKIWPVRKKVTHTDTEIGKPLVIGDISQWIIISILC